ncbi:PEP-CTERM sorting domain-containing protein [Massilia pseudoviolaceinigra]|uniref:PEP-CTERM sorting domain-containing protein n=1 Tax=Massilia pseudoviolaceinigra TaxID=3057165 RepID=UPI002796A2E3|nr:PEP-CTERM sorting domain-containing protein [Massilia sp. CCM 9206]MDQ1922509.1 PEP-CTERM sorting domain-containing protein [Massilia sp. CCM 9206]
MIKKMMCGLALMGCALSSHAQVQGFDWSYSGFVPVFSTASSPQPQYGPFDPNYVLKGRFYAEDRDHNGTFSGSELISFTIYGNSFLNCTGSVRCGMSDFSYTPGSVLNFDTYSVTQTGQWGTGWWEQTVHSYRANDSFYSVYETDWNPNGGSVYRHNFTPETKFAISAVPEPQTWLMLGAGIALLGAAKRRRSRNA